MFYNIFTQGIRRAIVMVTATKQQHLARGSEVWRLGEDTTDPSNAH